ncbi:MAG: right-handed parallel beta-helix repeat-containing protein, partial [Elusimicrobia bacterium]|nr:right-handed parallel beta-helix repeat-containing protein [Elusimicrobiota bacterium]
MPEATGASRRLSSPWILLATALLGGMLALPALAIESSSAHYTNARSAMDNSGQTLSSPHFSNGSAVGEVSLTTHTSSGYNLRSGLMPIDYYPGAVTNFSASRSGSEQITLQWTAPGDDAHASGTTAKSYVIKYSTKASESPALSVSNFSSANSVPGAPAPQVEGTVQSLVFSGLIPGAQYYFAIRAFEDDGLAGTLSAGATVQAGACATTEYVKQAGGADATKIQDAINLLPKTLTGYSCIDIQDNGTYNEQVTVEGFTNNGSSITIETDPSVAGKAVIDPPGGSTAAFVIANSSVNLENLSVAPTTLVAYGVRVSSDFVTLSSMSVVDNGGPSQIWSAGVLVSASSGTVIEASTVTVARGDGLKLSGSTATAVSNSELTDSDFAGYPLYVHGGFSNSFTVVTASGSSSVRIDAGSQYDTISGSSFSAENFGGYALWINGASSNTVTDSYLSSPNGYGVFLDTGAEHNTITQSTAAAGGMGAYALFAQAASSNTISYSVLTSVNGTAVEMASEANWDTLGHDTISAPSGSGFNDALRVENSVHNTISHGVVKSSSGNALHLAVGADWNTIDNSTLLGSGSNNAGLFIDGGSSNTVSVSISSAAGGSGILLANSGGKGG